MPPRPASELRKPLQRRQLIDDTIQPIIRNAVLDNEHGVPCVPRDDALSYRYSGFRYHNAGKPIPGRTSLAGNVVRQVPPAGTESARRATFTGAFRTIEATGMRRSSGLDGGGGASPALSSKQAHARRNSRASGSRSGANRDKPSNTPLGSCG
jgi:hypothetical protein